MKIGSVILILLVNFHLTIMMKIYIILFKKISFGVNLIKTHNLLLISFLLPIKHLHIVLNNKII